MYTEPVKKYDQVGSMIRKKSNQSERRQKKGYLPFFHNRIQIGEFIWNGEILVRWFTPEGNDLVAQALLFFGVLGEFK